MSDLIIRNAQVVRDGSLACDDVAVENGVITGIGPSLSGNAKREIDATGMYLFPGFIDAHVHFNEPGREHWEGLPSGSSALAAGGGTCFFDMPLNSDPPVLDAQHFDKKRRIAQEKSVLDFALWGGLCPGHTDRIDEMAEAGAIGFKAFLCNSGIEEFAATDPATLREGLLRAKPWNVPVAVHAEAPEVLDRDARSVRGTSLRDFLDSRSKAAEVASIRMACEIAGETEGALHIVHVSCLEGLEAIAEAREAGVNVTAETCPHYLMFDTDAAVKIGARAKCAPPLRERSDVENLWEGLLSNMIDTVGSDHSPAPPDMKTGDDFFKIWGGIAGCQHAFPAMLGELHRRAAGQVTSAAEWLAANPAKRFRLSAHKGHITVGHDADLTLVKFGEFPPITAAELLYRHSMSLYEGLRPQCRVVHVIRRGEHIVRDSSLAPDVGRGIFIRPPLPA